MTTDLEKSAAEYEKALGRETDAYNNLKKAMREYDLAREFATQKLREFGNKLKEVRNDEADPSL